MREDTAPAAEARGDSCDIRMKSSLHLSAGMKSSECWDDTGPIMLLTSEVPCDHGFWGVLILSEGVLESTRFTEMAQQIWPDSVATAYTSYRSR